jgi:Uma2 family endonuclease
VATELHCRLQVGGDVRFRLPDVAVVVGDANPKENRYLEGAPALAIEIRSPEDSITQLVRKIDEYLANGSEMAWLILPEEKGLMLFTPGAPVRTLLEHDTLEGGAILPGFQIRVNELFA